MSPYSSAHQGTEVIHQGGVCAHDRAVTRGGIRYWLGQSPMYAWGTWLHDDDETVCEQGPD